MSLGRRAVFGGMAVLAATAALGKGKEMTGKVILKVGGKSFPVELEKNPTAEAFYSRLPLELAMEELNGNEKYCYLGKPFPARSMPVGRIEAGDLMLFGNRCVVVFYKSFRTSYTYTRIGRIGNAESLESALGPGDPKVRFEAD